MNAELIVLKKGSEIMREISRFCTKKGIKSAYFSAIGAVSSAEIGFYDFSEKGYRTMKFSQALEIASLAGNVALSGDGIALHAHATFCDEEGNAKGGHLMSAVVFPTCEVFIVPLQKQLRRKPDEETGLRLIEPS